MFCPKCGAPCSDGERFCSACGAPLPQPAPAPEKPAEQPAAAPAQEQAAQSAKKGFKPSPKLIGIAAVAVVAVVAVVALFSLFGGKGGSGGYASYSANALVPVYAADNTLLLYSGGKEVGSVDDLFSSWYSADYSVATCADTDGTLYLATSKGVTRIADDVQYTTFYPRISSNGAALLYKDEDNDLYWYSVSKKSAVRVKGFDEDCSLQALSPDGSTLVFVKRDGGEVEGFTCQYGKDPVSLGDDKVPVAVSNGGTYVYYVKLRSGSTSEGTLYVAKGDKETKLASDFSVDSFLFSNLDGTQLLFESDGKTYLTSKGGEKQKFLSGSVWPIDLPLTPDIFSSGYYLATVLVSNFQGQYYQFASDGWYDSVYYVNEKGESSKLSSSAYDFRISADGSEAIYLKNGDLVKVTDPAKNTTKALTEDAEITSFVATSDLSAVYYYNEDDELYYQKGTGKPVKVGDDVDDFFLAPDGSTCLILSDEVLYTSKGKAMTAVKGVDDVVNYSYEAGQYCFFQSAGRNSCDIYITSGSSIKLLASDIDLNY